MKFKVLLIAILLSVSSVGYSQEVIPSAASRFAQLHTQAVPDFQKHVVPLLGRLGCNSAKCHGSFQGQGGFRLSLFGFDFRADHAALTSQAHSAIGNRLDIQSPEKSLIVLKPTRQTDHEGGRRFELDSWEHHLLLRWIESGAKGAQVNAAQAEPGSETLHPAAAGDTNQVLVGLRYEPPEILFQNEGDTSQIKVIAEWQTGEREDVTCLAQFQTNNDAVVSISKDGKTTSIGVGDSHIVAYYDNGVAAIPVLRPYGATNAPSAGIRKDTANQTSHPIDRFVNEKLTKLNLVPSERCTDAEFLRRVSIDMTGTLPVPDEVIAFLADTAVDKRARKIDDLLERSTYAAWWANKLCDFTGCNPASISSLLEVATEDGYVKASRWYDWIYERVARNEAYDDLVAGMVLTDLSGRADESMPYFWSRQSLKQPKDTAMSVAHAFLGIQLQCAECHKHPFDRWTQADFNDFSRFFDTVTTTKRTSSVEQAMELSLLRSHIVSFERGDDSRKPIMDWMRDTNNPWFARAFVNRVWASYFHQGIVDPPDQFTPANPPSNPALLDWLAAGFIDNGYDMKWLHRQIAGSETYQRSWKPNETNRDDRRNFSRAIPRRIPAEVIYDAMKQSTAATETLDDVRTNLKRRASGHLSMRMAGTHAMKVFGKPDRALNCDCERVNEPTLLQAVFTQNDPLVRMRVADSGWIAEIEELESAGKPLEYQELITHVYLRTVGRSPTADEAVRSLEHLESVDSLSEGISDLMWAMLNTKEFLLNH